MEISTEIKDEMLEDLIYNFYKYNLNFSLKSDDITKMDWEWQQNFLNATVNSKLVKKYPVSSQYSKLFLKKLLDILEPHQEVHDDLYAHLCTAMTESSKDGFCYRHYVIGKDLNNVVTMKETRNMVVSGTTGLKTWEAALMVSDWALCNKNIFRNKNVLELGSGVGFAGITIAKLCEVKSLLLSDCHDEVLKTISENIQINFSHFKKKDFYDSTLYESENKSVGVLLLDWMNIENLKDCIIPDIIIGADIVYDPSLLQPLCTVLQTFCNKNKHIEIYIASVIRNEETFEKFLKALEAVNLSWEIIDLPKSILIEWDESVQKCLLKIKLK